MPDTPGKRSILPAAAALIVIAGLLSLLVWCWFYKGHPATPGSETPKTATGPCFEGADNPLPAGYTFYENTSLGFKFAYPSAWGTVSVATTPEGGVGGHYLVGSFSANSNVTFGGNATDYIVSPRDGMPLDNPGYLTATNKYYAVQIWKLNDPISGTNEDKHELHLITEPTTLKNGCNAKALVTKYPKYELLEYSYDQARINLQSNNAYYGVNIVLKNPTDTSRAELDTLLGTFQLIP